MIVKIVGVGTLGCNIIRNLPGGDTGEARLIAIDTDQCWLEFFKASYHIQLGKSVTKGLGTGGDINLGRHAAMGSTEDIKHAVRDTDILFIVAGMGGGTGSGAAPLVAEISKKSGTYTVAVVTLP
ncbi:cell division protein FtsZ, partial [Chloroflexota bacterium]